MAKLTPNTGIHGKNPSKVDQWGSFPCKIEGAFPLAPTTPSTQATGAAGNLAVWCNLTQGFVSINGVNLSVLTAATGAVQADLVCFASAPSFVIVGQAAFCHIVAYHNKGLGTVTLKAYFGAAAVLGAQIALTDAELNLKPELANNDWIELGRFYISRTADTVLGQVGYDYNARPAGNRTV